MLSLLAVALASPWTDELARQPLGAEFAAWMGQHAQAYPTRDETLERFATWQANRAYIGAHNAAAAQGEHSFTLALNQFGAMDNAEYRRTQLGFRAKAQRGGAVAVLPGAAPDSWDWRPKGVVTAVKNQAQCGSCWAFSAVATMEGAFNLASNGTVPSACTSKCGPNKTPCCEFSEQELVDCVNGGKDNCKTGGEMHDGVLEIVKQQGGKLETEQEYPYVSGGGDSPGVCHAKGGVQTGISGYTQVAANEDALKVAAYSKPILSIGIDAAESTFQFYSSGIYDEPACKNKIDQLDHGVAIVGYGSGAGPAPSPPSPGPAPAPAPGPGPAPGQCGASSEAACEKESGCHWCYIFCMDSPCAPAELAPAKADYWIVRNSWGESWGMDGYILMSRNKDNQCGVATDAIFADLKKADELLVV